LRSLDLIALSAAEALSLAELLRFFEPPAGIRIRFLHPPGVKWDFELNAGWLQELDVTASEHSSLQVRGTAALLNDTTQALHLWSSTAFNCLELSPQAEFPEAAQRWFKGFRPCCLRSERKQFSGLAIDGVPLAVESQIGHLGANDVLLTSSSELRQALFLDPPEDLWHFVITPQTLMLDLRLDDSAEAYLRAYRQLRAFCEVISEPATIGLHSIRQAYERQQGAYSFFAEFYDRYMAHVDYSSWLTMILSWARRFHYNPPQIVLELACGTANISEQLVFKGMSVDACDYSPFMLREAARKCFKPRLFKASMDQPLPFQNHYDLVLCLFDSVNYLLKIEELKATFSHVKAALKPGGLFVFDISTIMNSRENFDDLVQQHRFGNALIVHHARFDELSMRQKSSLTLFRKQALRHVMSEENHTQRVYRHREIISLLTDSGLELLGIFSPDTRVNLLNKRQQSLDEQYPRLFYMLRRPHE